MNAALLNATYALLVSTRRTRICAINYFPPCNWKDCLVWLHWMKNSLEPLVWFRWGFQQNVPLLFADFNQIENWKCHMFDFGLILLDRITNNSISLIMVCHCTVNWEEIFIFTLFIFLENFLKFLIFYPYFEPASKMHQKAQTCLYLVQWFLR